MKLLSALFATLLLTAQMAQAAPTAAESSADTKALGSGAAIPTASLSTPNGESTSLTELARKPTIAIFYRGGWCPYCNRHLKEIQGVQQQLLDMGYQIVGISPDKPQALKKTIEGQELHYQLLSDNKGDAARAFGIAFDAGKEYGPKYGDRITTMLENASGEKHHQLPVPSVFILKDGKVAYSYANVDYRTRLSADELLKAAKAAM